MSILYTITPPHVKHFPASTLGYNHINEWPLQFLRTGLYHRSYGYLNVRTTGGYWWSDTAGSATNGRRLGTGTGDVSAQHNDWRGYGFALRCTATCNAVTSSTIQQ
jgi:hypothetical protein